MAALTDMLFPNCPNREAQQEAMVAPVVNTSSTMRKCLSRPYFGHSSWRYLSLMRNAPETLRSFSLSCSFVCVPVLLNRSRMSVRSSAPIYAAIPAAINSAWL